MLLSVFCPVHLWAKSSHRGVYNSQCYHLWDFSDGSLQVNYMSNTEDLSLIYGKITYENSLWNCNFRPRFIYMLFKFFEILRFSSETLLSYMNGTHLKRLSWFSQFLCKVDEQESLLLNFTMFCSSDSFSPWISCGATDSSVLTWVSKPKTKK